MSFRTCRSVGESSTINTRLMVMLSQPSRRPRRGNAALMRRDLHMRPNGLEQALLGKRLGQILVRPDHATACTVEQAILGGQHHDRCLVKPRIFLVSRAGLITV